MPTEFWPSMFNFSNQWDTCSIWQRYTISPELFVHCSYKQLFVHSSYEQLFLHSDKPVKMVHLILLSILLLNFELILLSLKFPTFYLSDCEMVHDWHPYVAAGRMQQSTQTYLQNRIYLWVLDVDVYQQWWHGQWLTVGILELNTTISCRGHQNQIKTSRRIRSSSGIRIIV